MASFTTAHGTPLVGEKKSTPGKKLTYKQMEILLKEKDEEIRILRARLGDHNHFDNESSGGFTQPHRVTSSAGKILLTSDPNTHTSLPSTGKFVLFQDVDTGAYLFTDKKGSVNLTVDKHDKACWFEVTRLEKPCKDFKSQWAKEGCGIAFKSLSNGYYLGKNFRGILVCSSKSLKHAQEFACEFLVGTSTVRLYNHSANHGVGGYVTGYDSALHLCRCFKMGASIDGSKSASLFNLYTIDVENPNAKVPRASSFGQSNNGSPHVKKTDKGYEVTLL